MVQPSYMLRKPSPPSAARVFVDQRITPALINAAGSVEALIERVAGTTRAAPAPTLMASLITGFVLGSLYVRQKRCR